jgi:hypothetical protein
LLKQSQTDESRLEAADIARDEEQILTASKIYLRLSLSEGSVRDTARQRLEQLQSDGRDRLASIDQRLDSASETDVETVLGALDEYEKLSRQFAKVPKINYEILKQLSRQRRSPEYAAVLKEPEAAELVATAKKHEETGQLCCAVLVYEEAAKRAPAPSAVVAKRRMEELLQEPEIVKATENCRNLQWCHQRFSLAERLAKVRPQRARQMFAEIVQRAPEDSEIYESARQQVDELRDASG